MPIFETWDIIKVPFPYTDRPVRRRRPALVIVSRPQDTAKGLLWVLMVTSSENRGWDGDVEISDIGLAGLPVPSIVRTAKIATIDGDDSERLGTLPPADRTGISETLRQSLVSIIDR